MCIFFNELILLPFGRHCNDIHSEVKIEKKMLETVSLSKTAASYKMRHGLAKTFQDELIHDLKNTPFSWNIDKATSNKNMRVLSVLVLVSYMYYCNNNLQQEVVTHHLKSISLVHAKVMLLQVYLMYMYNVQSNFNYEKCMLLDNEFLKCVSAIDLTEKLRGDTCTETLHNPLKLPSFAEHGLSTNEMEEYMYELNCRWYVSKTDLLSFENKYVSLFLTQTLILFFPGASKKGSKEKIKKKQVGDKWWSEVSEKFLILAK